MTATEAEADRRRYTAEFTCGLRALADFLDAHPDLVTPYVTYEHDIFASDLDNFAAKCAEVGPGEKKADNSSFLEFSRAFSPSVKITVNISKAQSCTKLATGETREETIRLPEGAVQQPDGSYKITEPIYKWKCPQSWLNP